MQLDKIHHLDCFVGLKEMPDMSIDLIVTDPPYGMSFISNYRKEKYNPIENDNSLEWLPVLVKEMYRVLKENSQIYVFCSKHNIEIFLSEIRKAFAIKNILVWVKNNTSMGDLKGAYADKTEFVIFASKGKSRIRGFRTNNVLEYPRTGNMFHPTEKNVNMLSLMIEKSSDKDMVVLDPFMGSGSTAIACQQTGRRFVGFEISKEYVEIAEKRLAQRSLTEAKASGVETLRTPPTTEVVGIRAGDIL